MVSTTDYAPNSQQSLTQPACPNTTPQNPEEANFESSTKLPRVPTLHGLDKQELLEEQAKLVSISLLPHCQQMTKYLMKQNPQDQGRSYWRVLVAPLNDMAGIRVDK